MRDNAKNSESVREFSSIQELALKTGKCYRTIHRAVKAGKIKHIRCGGSILIPMREVQRVLSRGF